MWTRAMSEARTTSTKPASLLPFARKSISSRLPVPYLSQHKLLSIDSGKSRFSGHAVVAHIRVYPPWLISQWRCWLRRQFFHGFLSHISSLFVRRFWFRTKRARHPPTTRLTWHLVDIKSQGRFFAEPISTSSMRRELN